MVARGRRKLLGYSPLFHATGHPLDDQVGCKGKSTGNLSQPRYEGCHFHYLLLYVCLANLTFGRNIETRPVKFPVNYGSPRHFNISVHLNFDLI